MNSSNIVKDFLEQVKNDWQEAKSILVMLEKNLISKNDIESLANLISKFVKKVNNSADTNEEMTVLQKSILSSLKK